MIKKKEEVILNDNQSMPFLSRMNGRIIFGNNLQEKNSPAARLQYYIKMQVEFLLLTYSRIALDKIEKNILFSDVENLIKRLDKSINIVKPKTKKEDIPTKLFNQSANIINDLKENFQTTKSIHNLNLNIGNVYSINDSYDRLQENISEIEFNDLKVESNDSELDYSNIMQKIVSNINLLSIKMRQINNFTKVLKVTENKLLILLLKFTELLEEYEKNEQINKNELIFHSLSVDDKCEPIITFENKPSSSQNDTRQQKKILEEVYMSVVQEYKKQIEEIIIKPLDLSKNQNQDSNQNQNSNQNLKDINFFFQTEITEFTTELSNIIKNSFKNTRTYSELSQKLTEFLNANHFSEDDKLFEYDFDRSSSDYYFFVLLFISKNQFKLSGEIIVDVLNSISKFYEDYINGSILSRSFGKLVEVLRSNKSKSIISYDFTGKTIDERMANLLNQIQNQGEYFYIKVLYQIIIGILLNTELFRPKLLEAINNYTDNENDMHPIKGIFRINEINSSYKIYFDGEMHFFLQKAYNFLINVKKVKREMRILKKKISKYIVQIDEEKQEMRRDKIFIQYFPIGTLENIIQRLPQNNKRSSHQSQNKSQYYKAAKTTKLRVELTNVERIVILLEIATALDDLHSHEEYHGNLCDQFIFINSQLDAYIGSFCHEVKLEGDARKPRGPFYFRAPEKFTTNKQKKSDYQTQDEIEEEDEDEDEDDDDDDDYDENQMKNEKSHKSSQQKQVDEEKRKLRISKHQMNDIFSYGVIMHEVLTDTNPESRMGNKSSDERLQILKGNYCEFLFEGENNECFDENSFDSFGNNLSDFKGIIEKCLKMNQEERYPSMKEIINSIKETSIYKRNKTEIEYRLSNAIDSRKYECTISDIVDSYLQGVLSCYDDIVKFLLIYDIFSLSEDNLLLPDIIESTLTTFKCSVSSSFDE